MPEDPVLTEEQEDELMDDFSVELLTLMDKFIDRGGSADAILGRMTGMVLCKLSEAPDAYKREAASFLIDQLSPLMGRAN